MEFMQLNAELSNAIAHVSFPGFGVQGAGADRSLTWRAEVKFSNGLRARIVQQIIVSATLAELS